MYVIAEAGINHNGDIELAKKMIHYACWAGCDAIKFQTYRTDKLKGLDRQTKRYCREAELDIDDHQMLMVYCGQVGIEFMSSAFDIDSLIMLSLFTDKVKIPSGQITDKEYLKAASYWFPEIIMSTGMATLDEVVEAVKNATFHGSKMALLHCTSSYPCPPEDVNLRAMWTLRDYFQVPIGLSDHTLGIEIPMAAAAMGAQIIEKHFTLDREMDGPDHKMSLLPEELKAMVDGINDIEKAMGTGEKKPAESERDTMARK